MSSQPTRDVAPSHRSDGLTRLRRLTLCNQLDLVGPSQSAAPRAGLTLPHQSIRAPGVPKTQRREVAMMLEKVFRALRGRVPGDMRNMRRSHTERLRLES